MTAQLLDLARQYSLLLPLLVGLLAFIETFAFLGLLVPGVAVLFALAALAGTQETAITPLLMGAFIGAILGDQLSFFLGRYASPWLKRRWPLKNHPQWQQRGERYFDRYGGMSVVIGRFVGPIRPLIPFVAGSCRMPALRFTAFNLASALAWAPAYLLPGYLTGLGATRLPLFEETGTLILIAIISLLLAFQQIHLRLHPQAGLWHWLKRHGFEPQLTATSVLLATSLVLFGLSVWVQLSGRMAAINQSLYELLHGVGQQLPFFIEVITHFGDPPLLIGLVTLAAALGWWRARDIAAVGLMLGGLGIILLNHLLKETFTVPRPAVGQALIDSYSFPSGHASGACAIYAMLAIRLLTGQSHRVRHWGYMLTALLILSIGLSRALLGVHWPLDIVAGMLEGMAVAALYRLWLQHRLPMEAVPLQKTLAALLAIMSAYALASSLI